MINMKKKKLIILTSSYRMDDRKELLPAIERYDGVYFRLLRKYMREGRLSNVDILILTERYGLISARKKIPFYIVRGKIGELSLNEEEIRRIRLDNLKKLKKISQKYSEIYINVGKQYLKLIEGIESISKCKITYATGNGLGAKATHMKNWILSL